MSGVAARAAGVALNPSFKLWTKPAEVWPVIAATAVAVGWCTYMSGRGLLTSPDVSFNRDRRQSLLKDEFSHEKDGLAWSASHKKHYAKDVSKISIFSPVERKY